MCSVSNWVLSTSATNLQYDVSTKIYQQNQPDGHHLENSPAPSQEDSFEKFKFIFNVSMLPNRRDSANLGWNYSVVTSGITL